MTLAITYCLLPLLTPHLPFLIFYVFKLNLINIALFNEVFSFTVFLQRQKGHSSIVNIWKDMQIRVYYSMVQPTLLSTKMNFCLQTSEARSETTEKAAQCQEQICFLVLLTSEATGWFEFYKFSILWHDASKMSWADQKYSFSSHLTILIK